jgi:hypothetical protein
MPGPSLLEPLTTEAATPIEEVVTAGSPNALRDAQPDAPRVTLRAIFLGLLFCLPLTFLNVSLQLHNEIWILGGTHLPLGAIFLVGILALGINPLLRLAARTGIRARLFSPTELMTIYIMLSFALLISTAGTDNFFLSVGVGLFYFSTRENRFAELFYDYIPAWMAPGWDGQKFSREVVEGFYNGGMSASQVPWHAWSVMLVGWSLFLLLTYATLFFASLILRRQWVENEALSFPLLEIPLAMTQNGTDSVGRPVAPPSREFWSNGALWMGFGFAFLAISLRSLNSFFSEFPSLTGFFSDSAANAFGFEFTEYPYNVLGRIDMNVYLGVIGIAFLLNREVSFSLWFFFLFFKLQMVLAGQLGYPVSSLPKDGYLGKPAFMTWQTMGGWFGVAALLLWSARGHLALFGRAAWGNVGARKKLQGEPFSPRLVVVGFALSFIGLLLWSAFAGISPLVSFALFVIYLVVSVVIGRLVVEAGFIFPQLTFGPLDFLIKGVFGTSAIGAENISRITMVQPSLFLDARTNLFPAWMHALKVSDSLGLDARQTRRLLGASWLSIVCCLLVSLVSIISIVYSRGALSTYDWFTRGGPQGFWNNASDIIARGEGVDPSSLGWSALGAAAVFGMMALRTHLLWFPFHPLGFILATGFPIQVMWFSILIGWVSKTLLLKYGGQATVAKVRPFMIGLILGNVTGMMLWVAIALWRGNKLPYWFPG